MGFWVAVNLFILSSGLLSLPCFAAQSMRVTDPSNKRCVDALVSDEDSGGISELLKEPFIDAHFSKPFLENLSPINEGNAMTSLFTNNPISETLMTGFRYQTNEGTDEIHLDKPKFFRNSAIRIDHIVVIGIFRDHERKVVGFWASTFTRDMDGNLIAYGDYLKMNSSLPSTKGLGDYFFKFDTRLLMALGVVDEIIEAGWLGRLIWARAGYPFDSATLMHENGVALSQNELIRRNFSRFLRHNGISINDVLIELKHGETLTLSPLSPDMRELQNPLDYLNLSHKAGRKVRISPYIDDDVLGPKADLDIGRAFTLEDYRPRPTQEVNVDLNGKSLSDIAMPTWIGRRHLLSK